MKQARYAFRSQFPSSCPCRPLDVITFLTKVFTAPSSWLPISASPSAKLCCRRMPLLANKSRVRLFKWVTKLAGSSQATGLQADRDIGDAGCRQICKLFRHGPHFPDPWAHLPSGHPAQQDCTGGLRGSCCEAGHCHSPGAAARRHPDLHDGARRDRGHLLCSGGDSSTEFRLHARCTA